MSAPLASLAQLEQSHRRHDDVMEGLVEAARRLAAGRPDTFDVDRINEAVVYFKRSITRLFLDEEGSLFPRLSTRRPELAEQLASLSAGHPEQVKLQDQIGELAAALDGASRQGAHKELLEAATELAEAHHARVARLEHVFTIARAALTAQDDADIVAEMEKRRDRRDERDELDGGEAIAASAASAASDAREAAAPVGRRQRSETIAERPLAKRAVPAGELNADPASGSSSPSAKKRAARTRPAAKTTKQAKAAKAAKATKATKAGASKPARARPAAKKRAPASRKPVAKRGSAATKRR